MDSGRSKQLCNSSNEFRLNIVWSKRALAVSKSDFGCNFEGDPAMDPNPLDDDGDFDDDDYEDGRQDARAEDDGEDAGGSHGDYY